MTQEEKELLMKNLSARLPYGVKCKVFLDINNHILNECDKYSDSRLETINYQSGICTFEHLIGYNYGQFPIEDVTPYLRPMSSMTDEEQFQLGRLMGATSYNLLKGEYSSLKELLEYVYKNHIDLFGLIPKGLSLEAPEDMYK